MRSVIIGKDYVGKIIITRGLSFVTLTAVYDDGSKSPPAKMPIFILKKAIAELRTDKTNITFQNRSLPAINRRGDYIHLHWRPSPKNQDYVAIKLLDLIRVLSFKALLRSIFR